jgi:F420-dependent oxidoreductase-like protein
MLTALAQATKRLRLGTLVTANTYRHPALLAKMVATRDVISAGRVELGIGTGASARECAAYGIPLGTVKERSDRLEEACEVIIGLLSRETTSFSGIYYQLTDAMCNPKPLQQPHPPICVGGRGEKRTLRTAARYAQHWNVQNATPEEFAHKRDVLYQHCADLGRDPSEITLSCGVNVDTAHGFSNTVAAVEQLAEVGLDLAVLYLRPPLSAAVLAPLAEAMAFLR